MEPPIDPLSEFLGRKRHGHDGEEDYEAMRHLKGVQENNSLCIGDYGYGTWGYTGQLSAYMDIHGGEVNASSVLRTVYTEESDTLFPQAINKLRTWVHYGIQATRFPIFGAKGEARKKITPIYNDELWKRFNLDIIEDKSQLQSQDPDLTRDNARLSNYFRQWVASKAQNPLDYRNPRFLDCIIINEDSMRSLLTLPNKTPPLRVPVDRREKSTWPADDDAFVWLLDCRAQSVSQNDEYRQYGGREVVKLGISDIRLAWFYRQGRSDRWEGLPYNGGDDWDAEYFLSM